MGLPFEAYIDNRKVERWSIFTEGKNLLARVLPKNEWSEDLKKEITEMEYYHGGGVSIEKFDKPIPVLEEPVHLYLFIIPIFKYRDLEENIHEMKGKEVTLGEMPMLVKYKQPEISIDLQKGFLYDLITIGTYRGNRSFGGGGRLSTENGKVPPFMTLDELKLFAIEDLDMLLEEAKNIKAKINPMTAWKVSIGRMIVAGFEFEKSGPMDNYGVMVQHNGVVTHYHDCSKEKLREVLQV